LGRSGTTHARPISHWKNRSDFPLFPEPLI
jgi:hypothetical protein